MITPSAIILLICSIRDDYYVIDNWNFISIITAVMNIVIIILMIRVTSLFFIMTSIYSDYISILVITDHDYYLLLLFSSAFSLSLSVSFLLTCPEMLKLAALPTALQITLAVLFFISLLGVLQADRCIDFASARFSVPASQQAL